MGNSDRAVGAAGRPGRGRRASSAIGPPGSHPNCSAKRLLGWVGAGRGQVPRLDRPVRQGPRAQRPEIPREPLADRRGEERHRRLPPDRHLLEGYRRLHLPDDRRRDVVACSPASVYRSSFPLAGLLKRWNSRSTSKWNGFRPAGPSPRALALSTSPTSTLAGTFYYLCGVLDAPSRAVVHWEIRERMTELRRRTDPCNGPRSVTPGVTPRVITDNGPQKFVATGDFKEFIRLSGMTHVKTSCPTTPNPTAKSNASTR